MGMTRDEALKVWLPVIQMGVETMPECKEALDMAIETMRKYQKIAELYDYWRSGKCEYTISCMENIGKVLRNGKID